MNRLSMGVLFVLSGLLLAACMEPGDQKTGEKDVLRSSFETARTDTVDLPETNYYEIRVAGMEGRMVLRLYDETPVHRDNFKTLVEENFFDGTTFHRVISGFMIQGGDPNSRDDDPNNDGAGGPSYTLPAEIHPALYHKRGAVAAARSGDHVNPERRSSGSQFYIVQGSPMDSLTLKQVEMQNAQAMRDPEFRFSDEISEKYRTEGGAPFLDGQYTVFGEIVEGFDLLDRVANVDTPRKLQQPGPEAIIDRPFQALEMTVRPLPDYANRKSTS